MSCWVAARPIPRPSRIRNIFGKLGADSRVEVARTVERADRLAAWSA